jgi:hypothetical protein
VTVRERRHDSNTVFIVFVQTSISHPNFVSLVPLIYLYPPHEQHAEADE